MRNGVSGCSAIICVIVFISIGLVGCKPGERPLAVEVRNATNLEVSNVGVKLANTTRTIDTLEPEDSVTITFPVPTGDASFDVTADCSSGGSIQGNVGYVDHSYRRATITFTRSNGRESMTISAECE